MEKFVAVVVDVNDPEQFGRLKIRIYGLHDDTSRVPDDMLPWARVLHPVNTAMHNGVSGPVTGAVVGTTVVGYFVDEAKQIPLVEGVLGRNSDTVRDIPKANTGEDYNEVIQDNIFHVGIAELKFAKSKTIGTIQYSGQSIEKMVSFIEQGQFSAALDQLREIRSQVQYLKRLITDSPIEQVNSIISGFQSDLGYLIKDAVADVITTQTGHVVTPSEEAIMNSVLGTVDGSKLINQIKTATGVEFTTANHIVGSISTTKSKNHIQTASDAIDRINGHTFVMNNTMKQIENTFQSIKLSSKRDS